MGRVYIIESALKLRDDLIKALAREYQVQVCERIECALEDIKSFQPDLLVMDMTVPDLDGIGLLNVLFTAGIRPKLILSLNYVEDRVQYILSQFKVSYILSRPVHRQVLLNRIMDVLLGVDGGENLELRRIANNLLLKLGLHMELQGYRSTLEAVVYVCEHPDCKLSNELYVQIGKLLGGNGKQVEHCIRTCLNNAWLNRDEQIWELYFPRNRYGHLTRLTNGAFLKRIAFAINDFYEFATKEQPQQKNA